MERLQLGKGKKCFKSLCDAGSCPGGKGGDGDEWKRSGKRWRRSRLRRRKKRERSGE